MLQGYLLGSYMYLSIVFIVPLSLGVVAVALDLPLNNTEALEGLVMPASAYVLLGKGGQHSHCMAPPPAPGNKAVTLSLGARAVIERLVGQQEALVVSVVSVSAAQHRHQVQHENRFFPCASAPVRQHISFLCNPDLTPGTPGTMAKHSHRMQARCA